MKNLNLFLISLLILFTSNVFAQTQKGTDIDGEAAANNSGISVSMPDANTVAIGADYNNANGSFSGHVRIYNWTGSTWTQKGLDIDGEAAGDYSGWSVSMPDANTVAIGAFGNDGNGSKSGHVRIYEWNGSTWVQKGLDIDGEAADDRSGRSISMPDANTVAIGAPNNDGNGSNSGHVRIYSWNGSTWVQKGIDLNGEAAGDQSGCSVSMPDANTVAIGAIANGGNGGNSGHVRIYTWNGSAWVQKGLDLDGEASGDQSGWSVSMPDVNTVAIGARENDGNGIKSGHVRIYTWNGSAWVQKGLDIDGEAAEDYSGQSVSMPDANTVAIGSILNYANFGTPAGHVRIYSWNGSAWTQNGTDIDAEAAGDNSGGSVSMPDANTVAIGARLNDGNGNNSGHARVYSLCTAPTQPNTITGSATLCTGTIETYSVTNDAAATGYTWILPSGWSGSSTTNSIIATAGASGGTIEVTAENACGVSSVQTLVITVNDAPAQPASIIGNTALCYGDNQIFSVTNDPNADSYNWTLPGGWSGTSTTNSINATTGSAGGTIEVTAENACGVSTAQTLAITVNDVPAQPSSIVGNTALCNGDNQIFSVTNDPNADTYNWTLPVGWSGTSTTNSINATTGSTGGTIEVTAENACGVSTAQTLAITVNDVPTQPDVINTSTTLCEGDEITMDVINDPNADTYSWSLPSGWSGSSTTNTIDVTAGSSGGVVSVTANNSCGNSSPQTISVTVNGLPVVIYDQNPNFTCVNYDAFSLGNTSPSGGTFSGTGVVGNNFNPSAAGIGTHDITYTYTDGNGCTNDVMQQIEVDGCLSLNEQENQSISVYPNPFDAEFIVEFHQSGNHTIELLNTLGQTIHAFETNEQSTVVTTKDLSPGVYYVRVVEENFSYKIIKK